MNERETTELWKAIVAELRAKGLSVPDVEFRLDGGRKRFGACHWTRNRVTGAVRLVRVTVSHRLAALNGPEVVGKTIRHGIAHAIAGHLEGHGPRWREVDRACGGDGSRCCADDVTKPDFPWCATCDGCERIHQMTRPPKRALRCKCGLGTVLAFRMAETADARTAPKSAAVERVLEMRRRGMGFVAIDAAHGIVGKKGLVVVENRQGEHVSGTGKSLAFSKAFP